MSKKTLPWVLTKRERAKLTDDELAQYIGRLQQELMMIRERAARLMARDQIGRDFFARGVKLVPGDTLLDLLQAYADVRSRVPAELELEAPAEKPGQLSHDDLPLFKKR